jgi:predicted secreted protein
MFARKSILVAIAVVFLGVSRLWAGDAASFVDLGFSPDGTIYMFAQYGIQGQTLHPWAELFVVDVSRNNFVPGGRVSYTHDSPAVAGQDGSGALYRLISRNSALPDRYGVSYLLQGHPLYISMENGDTGAPDVSGFNAGETIEFRDFELGASYKAVLVPYVEGSGASLKSSFYINLERTARDGSRQSYVVGTPQLKRPLIASYRIRKVMIAPRDGSIIFVIETKKQGDRGYDLRYMVEALRP